MSALRLHKISWVRKPYLRFFLHHRYLLLLQLHCYHCLHWWLLCFKSVKMYYNGSCINDFRGIKWRICGDLNLVELGFQFERQFKAKINGVHVFIRDWWNTYAKKSKIIYYFFPIILDFYLMELEFGWENMIYAIKWWKMFVSQTLGWNM